MIAEAIDDLGAQDRTIFISPVGCSVFAYYYFDVGNLQVAHGRAPAVATSVKRALPDSLVICYQGDGDLAAIGGNEILQAANRGEDFTVIFVNNAIYGMTGGQMAPTTLVGQKTSTSPTGRESGNDGFPMRVSELLSSLEGPTYIERVALYDNKTRAKARKAIRKALGNQIDGRGFSLVEILSPCPTGWGVTPVDACKWIEEKLVPYFPLGVMKDKSERAQGQDAPPACGGGGGVAGDSWIDPARQSRRIESSTASQTCLSHTATSDLRLRALVARDCYSWAASSPRQECDKDCMSRGCPRMGPRCAAAQPTVTSTFRRRPLARHSFPSRRYSIAMNKPSLDKFESEVVSGGLILYDSSLIDRPPTRDDVEVIALPATEMADKIGSAKSANMVALGALIGKTNLLDMDGVIEVVRAMTKNAALLELNLRAVESGFQFACTSANEDCLWGV